MAVAETAELLRASYWARDGSYGQVLRLLAGLSETFRSRPESQEFVSLVAHVQLLTVKQLGSVANR